MRNTELRIKSISELLGRIEIQIRNLNHQNLFDINILSENFFCGLFNLAFDLKLLNANQKSINSPIVDLTDSINRIAIQVTSDKSKAKIQKTLNGFVDRKLYEKYDRLIIFILGEKQKKYTKLVVPKDVVFNVTDDVIDFKSLLKHISFLSPSKIDRINSYLFLELSDSHTIKQKNTTRSKFERNQILKKKIEKSLFRSISVSDWQKYSKMLFCDPSKKFIYDRINIRSIDDRKYPEHSYNSQGFSNWIKGEIWDFYPNGLEFVFGISEKVVIESDGSWFTIDEGIFDPKAQNCWVFSRVPYDFIVEYETEVDEYNGYPTIFVEYLNNGSPFEKEVYGLIGFYNNEEPEKSRETYYLDENKKKIL